MSIAPLPPTQQAIIQETAQAPRASFADIKKLADNAELHLIHPHVLGLFDPKEGNRALVQEAEEKGRKEFLVVMFTKQDGKPLGEADRSRVNGIINLVQKIQGQGPVSGVKANELMKSGYMLITEPDVISVIKRLMPGKVIAAGASNGRA